MVESIEIAGRVVGEGQPCFIIAEAGVNHNGDVNLAKQLIDAAVDAGADAVKFQTFKAENVVSPIAPKADYQLKTTAQNESQLEMVRVLELSPDDHFQIKEHCADRNILLISTPFDEGSVDLLDDLDIPAFKVGSGEITNSPLLKYIAQKDKPVILSTGMSYLAEVDEAVRLIQAAGNGQIILLHCVSNYPAKPEDINLRAMLTMANAFQVPVGYSDHTLGHAVALAARALGACLIEKHLTLDSTLPGPDQLASLEPAEFKKMVSGIHDIEKALGHGRKIPSASEANTAKVARRSLIASSDIPAGTTLSTEMIAVKRPGDGIPPAMLPYIIGRTVLYPIEAGTVITLELLA
jgi:N,N'-diacetyllegionaminate synthase